MALILDGNGLIQGLSAGGLPDGSVNAGSLASTLDLSSKTMTFGNVTASGITFPASQSASGNPNTLDDYEEGTWTPAVAFGGGSTGLTYGDRKGEYVKVGRSVFVNLYIYINNKGSSTGHAAISGFPFTVNSNIDFFIPLGVRGALNSSGNQVSLYSNNGNTTTFSLYQCNLNGGTNSILTNGAFSNNTELNFNFWYLTSS